MYGGRGIYGKSLYLLFNSAKNLKLLLKNKGYLKNRSYNLIEHNHEHDTLLPLLSYWLEVSHRFYPHSGEGNYTSG